MSHPDEAVAEVADIEEVPSELVAQARLRHEQAESDLATPQEKKQAAVEQAHALSTRPDGSYAQLHETENPTLAVADSSVVDRLRAEVQEAEAVVKGEKPRAEDEELAKSQQKQSAQPKPAAQPAPGQQSQPK